MNKLFFILPFLFLLSSCAILDAPKRVAGFSIQKFEKEEYGRVSQTFEISKKESFDRAILIIKHFKARVTSKSFKKGYVIAFDFARNFDYCLDSTEVGFFIEETGENTSTLTIVSNNSLLAQNISKKFFSLMLNPPKKKEDDFIL